MDAIRLGLTALVLLSACAAAVDKWESFDTYDATAIGGDELGLATSANNNIVVGDDLAKTFETHLSASGVNTIQLESISTLTSTLGDQVSCTKNTVDQTYILPKESVVNMFQGQATAGFPSNPTVNAWSSMDIIDPTTGVPLITLSSNFDDNDVDAIINAALAKMGFTLTIDDFRSLQGSVQYKVDNTNSEKGITCNWGETKNLPVDMTDNPPADTTDTTQE